MNALPTILGTSLLFTAIPAQAVVILHTTYENNGGIIDPPGLANAELGYSAHNTYANQDPFKGVVEYGSSNATWLGNDAGKSYFLTAAHGLSGSSSTGFAYTDWQGNSFNLASASVTHHYPGQWDNVFPYAYDIAIMEVDSAIVIPGATQPSIYNGSDEAGKLITWVGHGIRGLGGGTATPGQDITLYGEGRAAGQNVIDTIYQDANQSYFEFDFDTPATAATELEGHISSGDSGAAGWIQINGQWMIAGIASLSGLEIYGENNRMTRVSASTDWIRDTYSGAQFAVPEPSSALCLSIGALFLIGRRHKN